jgi:hypothetical protein
MAMMCSARLMRRFPARESRWRLLSPEDASIGAVPFQEAKWARLANRRMSPTSPSSRAAPDGPMPFGYGIARAYAGHTDNTGPATTTYIKADLQAVATALAVLTGQPHPLATNLAELGIRTGHHAGQARGRVFKPTQHHDECESNDHRKRAARTSLTCMSVGRLSMVYDFLKGFDRSGSPRGRAGELRRAPGVDSGGRLPVQPRVPAAVRRVTRAGRAAIAHT